MGVSLPKCRSAKKKERMKEQKEGRKEGEREEEREGNNSYEIFPKMFTAHSNFENVNLTILRFLSVRTAKLNKTINSQCWRRCKGKRTLTHCW